MGLFVCVWSRKASDEPRAPRRTKACTPRAVETAGRSDCARCVLAYILFLCLSLCEEVCARVSLSLTYRERYQRLARIRLDVQPLDDGTDRVMRQPGELRYCHVPSVALALDRALVVELVKRRWQIDQIFHSHQMSGVGTALPTASLIWAKCNYLFPLLPPLASCFRERVPAQAP